MRRSLSDFPDLQVLWLSMENGLALDGDAIQSAGCLPTTHEALGSVADIEETSCGGLIPIIPVLRGEAGRRIRSSSLNLAIQQVQG